MIEYKTYTKQQLVSFVESDEFRILKNIPVSTFRVSSYINNPRMLPEDILMTAAFENNQMIAYRTVLPDEVKTGNKSLRFAWLSGTWVKPEFRRKGISTHLFNLIYSAWNGMLMYSNYAPVSKALYDKTGKFALLYSAEGIRGYMLMCLASVLPPRNKLFRALKPVCLLIDWFVNFFLRIRLSHIKQSLLVNGLPFEPLQQLDLDTGQIILNLQDKEYTKRGIPEFQWIFQYPWIKSQQDDFATNKRYFFSTYAKKFDLLPFVVRTSGDKPDAFFILSHRDEMVKLPYIYGNREAYILVSQYLLNYCLHNTPAYITIYNSQLAGCFQEQCGRLFIYTRKQTKNVFATRELIAQLPPDKPSLFQDGDGDSVCT